ncbi:MAG: DUF1285 domain-containing protein [Moraxellaceae bacterium]|nr:MAG: DUF1285 domain-containing protein [Moraxellaceae bacterium]
MNKVNHPKKPPQQPSADQQASTVAPGASLSKIAALFENGESQGKRPIPPLEQWNPQFCGTMNLTVKANGEWWHEGSKITRERLVRLFSTVLWRENDGQYYLKTPVEKLLISVEDAPLLVTRIEKVCTDGKEYLTCITQTDDVIVIDAEHPVLLREYAGEMRPYINVRWNLDALIHRNAFYHLLNEGKFIEQNGQTVVKFSSGDFEFCLNSEALAE